MGRSPSHGAPHPNRPGKMTKRRRVSAPPSLCPVVFRQKRPMQALLGLPPGPDGVLEIVVAPEENPLPLETDAGPPPSPAADPMDPRDTTLIVPSYRPGSDHLHAGAVHIGEPRQVLSGDAARAPAPAARRMAAPQGVRGDDLQVPAVAPAEPCRAPAHILGRSNHFERDKPATQKIQFLSRMRHKNTTLLIPIIPQT